MRPEICLLCTLSNQDYPDHPGLEAGHLNSS